jgi:hypothetical protein
MCDNKTLTLSAASLVLAAASTLGSAPRAIAQNQLPDFSGVWQTYREPGQGGRTSGFGAPSAGLPLTAEGQRLVEEYQQLVAAFQDNAATYCVPYGMPTMMEMVAGYPLEIIQRPEQITIVFEVEGETRRVYIGDKAYPLNRRFPNREGYSAGHWEGDTLVVETTSLTDGQDQRNYPHSDQATITERFSMETRDDGLRIIDYEMTLTDPVYYTEPVTYTARWQPLPDGQILPYNCTEEPWFKLLDMRRAQLNAGEPVTATMTDVYATEMYEAAAEE